MAYSSSMQCIKRIANLEAVVQRDEGSRGIKKLCQPEGTLYELGKKLFSSDKITILTGFPCLQNKLGGGQDLPPTETDGPSGAIAICRAFLRLKDSNEVVIATDVCNAGVINACASRGLHAETNSSWRVEIFQPKALWDDKEQQRLEDVARWSNHILAIERGSLASDGNAYTMSGKIMGPDLMAPLDQLFEKQFRLKFPNYSTACIGDGGNELGMGGIREAIAKYVPNGNTIASAAPSDILLCASVSNWGGYATAAALEVLLNTSNDNDTKMPKKLLPSVQEEIETIQASNDAGARDGITGKAELYVDGMNIDAHLGILNELESICKM